MAEPKVQVFRTFHANISWFQTYFRLTFELLVLEQTALRGKPLLRDVRYGYSCIILGLYRSFFVSERLCPDLSWNKDPEEHHRLASIEALFTAVDTRREAVCRRLTP